MQMAEDSPVHSPPGRTNERPPFTLNTQPAMTADEVNSAIRNMQSGTLPIVNVEEQLTYSITSSSLEELNLSDDGDFQDMTFSMSYTSLSEVTTDADNTPETLGIRVSSLTLKEQADKNGGNGPEKLEIMLKVEDLISLTQPDLDPLGSTNRPDSTRFKITRDDIEAMDLSRSGIAWEEFSYRVFADNDGNKANFLRVARKGPTEQNTVTFDEILEENQQYSVTTYISTAENAELANATTDYPNWVADRYLHLPPTLPNEVRDLANQIVSDANAETPWEKTTAVKRFLQQQIYSLEIEGPGPRDDGIHYFLFKTISEPCPSEFPTCDKSKRKGYSQYFGSRRHRHAQIRRRAGTNDRRLERRRIRPRPRTVPHPGPQPPRMDTDLRTAIRMDRRRSHSRKTRRSAQRPRAYHSDKRHAVRTPQFRRIRP